MEGAAVLANQLKISADLLLHRGALPDTGWHAHGAPILLVAVDAPMQVVLAGGRTASFTSAVVEAGVQHRLLSGGQPFLSLYVEGPSPLARHLRRRLLEGRPLATDVLARDERRRAMDESFGLEDVPGLFPFRECEVGTLDPRIASGLENAAGVGSLASVAAGVHLSESRFSHLFRSETGASFRHYRSWLQARSFVRTFVPGRSLTTHAHDSGFYDSSHLSNSFRKLVGLSPRAVLQRSGIPTAAVPRVPGER